MSKKEFNAKKYMEFLQGKETYVWDSGSSFGNKNPVRIIKDNNALGMRRLISDVIIIYGTSDKEEFMRDSVVLQKFKLLYKIIPETNDLVEFSKTNLKKKLNQDIILNILEIILVPQEHHNQFLKVINAEKDYSRFLTNPTYHFLLSELKMNDKEIAFLVEFARSCDHFIQLENLIDLTDMSFIEDEDERTKRELQYETTTIYLISLLASHLREALKLLWRFSDTEIYQKILSPLKETQDDNLEQLLKTNEEFYQEKGFLWETLKVIRNKIFHYVPKDAEKWVKQVKRDEKGRKPRLRSIDFTPLEMNLGTDFE
ncbi:MAG: hypothetical protein KAU62_08970 [Candidatus Heimdallarchaeota archaeon]|nr:hypothetical protein [Candidatus Heimdallarchaeota archaeon]MCK4611270.1 hypothetical protein [Candidatus Heimdallarchaeota archaeon]